MSGILTVLISLFFISCSSLNKNSEFEIKSPGYQYGKQWDEKALKSGFIER